MMKNDFYLLLKLKPLLVLEIFTFLSWLFACVEKCFDKKAMVNFNIYDVTDWTANKYNTHLPIISRSKGNQTTTFGQLIEYNFSRNRSSHPKAFCDKVVSNKFPEIISKHLPKKSSF